MISPTSFPLTVAHAASRGTIVENAEQAEPKSSEKTSESPTTEAVDVPEEAKDESTDSKVDDTVRDKTLFGYDCEAGRALAQHLSSSGGSGPSSGRESAEPKVDSETKDLPDAVPDRFKQKEDNPDEPIMYSKAGKIIPGEWINGVFIRYKKGTPRPPGFTTKDWQSIPHKIRKSIIADQRQKICRNRGVL